MPLAKKPMANRALLLLMMFLFPFVSLTSGKNGGQFIYNGFRGGDLRLKGLSRLHPNGLLQLTNTTQMKVGYAFHPNPITFNKSLSFSTSFVFAIYPNITNHGAHGLTMFISPSMNFDNATADAFLGLLTSATNGLSSNHLVAVELDTMQNQFFLGDIDDNHVGIDVNSVRSVSAASAAYYSEKEGKNESLKLTSTKIMQVWVDYDDREMLFNVTMAPIRVPKPSQRLLSVRVNLSGVLLDSMYVGFSASTSLTSSDHYILGWSWNQSGLAQSLDPSKLPSLPKLKTKRSLSTPLIALLVFMLLLLVVISTAACVIRRRKYAEVQEPWEKEYRPHRISYKDVYEATKGFKKTQLLGGGGFGQVYKGVLHTNNNLHVAVKRVSHESGQGLKEFVAEVVSMRRLRHRNLVQLLGYCRRKRELLLVYDFIPNGSLDKFLFQEEKPTLCWHQRFSIIKGVASALLYLHEEWEQVVLHRDVKASNVLLDAHMNARLGDFGLARLYDHGTNPQTTHVVGTVGYLAPEFASTGKATTASDVFSFGIFILEVACGRSPSEMDSFHGEEEDLPAWVFNQWKKGTILEASDPKLEWQFNSDEMEMVLKIGLQCSQSKPEARPTIRQVVQFFDGAATLPDMSHDFGRNDGNGLAGDGNFGWGTTSSFPPSFDKGISGSMGSTDSILLCGR